MNWAEYLSYSKPRIRSYDQYLLVDPVDASTSRPAWSCDSGRHSRPTHAFQMPLYMPVTTARRAVRS